MIAGCINTKGTGWMPPVFDPDGLVPTLRDLAGITHEARRRAEAARFAVAFQQLMREANRARLS